MAHLCDVNVWLSLTVKTHPQHPPAIAWWNTVPYGACAFSRVSQMGLLRLLTNRAVMGDSALTLQEAWALFDRIAHEDGAVLLPEPPTLDAVFRSFSGAAKSSTNVWTDAYLAAFAVSHGLKLVSFDQGFRNFPGLDLLLLSSR